MSMASGAPAGAVDNVVARIERLPTSWWHVKTRIIVGVATFFDAFDAIAIATVLPVLVPMWHLTPPQIGFMISAGYVGQLAGALLFGWIGERFGRMPAMIGSIAVFAVMSLVCAFAWDYNSFLWFRTLQGIGLGGEVPVAATYISELTRAKNRGRFVLLYELVFPIGLVAVSLIGLWVVPRLGWQWMFYIGALPAILALFMRSLLPESPRWLAVHGRASEAEAVVSLIESETQKATGQPLPPVQPGRRIESIQLPDVEWNSSTIQALKVSAGILGIVGGVLILFSTYLGVTAYTFLNPNSGVVQTLIVFAVPIAAIVGGGLAFVTALASALLMLLSAALGLILYGFATLTVTSIVAVAIGGLVALIASATELRREPWSDLFGPYYLRRTLVVWVIWFAAYFINYGLVIWLTTIFRTVYKLPLDVSLRYGLITQAAGFIGTFICALTIDHVGRRPYFAVSFAAAAVSLGLLAMHPTPTAEQVLTYVAAAYFFISTINIGAYLYTPELYPTRARALGVGTATAWLRFASMIGPAAVGFMIAGGLSSVFWMFAAAALIAAIVTAAFAIETKGRVLEEVSP